MKVHKIYEGIFTSKYNYTKKNIYIKVDEIYIFCFLIQGPIFILMMATYAQPKHVTTFTL
jgi:hypothetical protein